MRVGTVSVTVLAVALALTTIGRSTTSSATSHAVPAQEPAGFLANSTQAVCALTGEHGKVYKEMPYNYTLNKYGMVAGDSGSSFEYNGQVWWLFGNTDATQHSPWLKNNQSSRWPAQKTPLNSAVAEGSDSMAWSPLATQAPNPAAPYNGYAMPPNQQCPTLTFVSKTLKNGLTPYINPSVFPDPLFKTADYYVSLRRGELPEAGISEGGKMYVVFGTDNPANCADDTTTVAGPCAPPTKGFSKPCGTNSKGSRTRSVMAVYQSNGRFQGLYDLSAPSTRYAPLCGPKSPTLDDARFVNVQMANWTDGYVYIWGTEGGSNNNASPIYLARIPAATIATGAGIEYWNGTTFVPGPASDPETAAVPLFTDSPQWCAAQLGIQYNQYLDKWIMLYRCNEKPAPKGHPNGIYMRMADDPEGPWSAPTTIFNPATDPHDESGFCYFIYSAATCPANSDNATLAYANKPKPGGDYGPYIVANWTTGRYQSDVFQASTTIYYTLDTYDPYGQLIMRSTIEGPVVAPVCTKNCS
jgi:uncharacterized protein DUF4185